MDERKNNFKFNELFKFKELLIMVLTILACAILVNITIGIPFKVIDNRLGFVATVVACITLGEGKMFKVDKQQYKTLKYYLVKGVISLAIFYLCYGVVDVTNIKAIYHPKKVVVAAPIPMKPPKKPKTPSPTNSIVLSDSVDKGFTPPNEIENITSPKPLKIAIGTYDKISINDLYFTGDQSIKYIDNIVQRKITLEDSTQDYFISIMNTLNPDNKETLNRNLIYENLTITANNDEKNDMTEDLEKLIIETREKAFEIGKTRALAILLGRDNFNLAQIYYSSGSYDNAYKYYINSIYYYNKVVALTDPKDNDKLENKENDIYYIIGQVYHHIGDIPNISHDIRINAYLMGTTCLNLSLSRDCDKEEFNSLYYNAMVDHKLGIIINRKGIKILENAAIEYKNSLLKTNIVNNKLKICSYSLDVYHRLHAYDRQNTNYIKAIKKLQKEKDYYLNTMALIRKYKS
jgi:hypothetical protein